MNVNIATKIPNAPMFLLFYLFLGAKKMLFFRFKSQMRNTFEINNCKTFLVGFEDFL